MQRTFDYFKADPSGNITGFVIGREYPGLRGPIAKYIMQNIDKSVEQVGFISPSYEGYPLRLDMMGGEFCGNATRAYGFYAATFMDQEGEFDVEVYVSGTEKNPLYVRVNKDKSTAYMDMESPNEVREINVDGKTYKAYIFDGIAHIIAEEKEDKNLAEKIIKESKIDKGALGVIFFDRENMSIVPYVFVSLSETLVRESCCASGSVATACYLDIKDSVILKQPKGELEVIAKKDDQGNTVYEFGGEIKLFEKEKIKVELTKEEMQKVKPKQ